MDSTRKVSLKNVPECICLPEVFTHLEIGDNKNVKTLSKHIHYSSFDQFYPFLAYFFKIYINYLSKINLFNIL